MFRLLSLISLFLLLSWNLFSQRKDLSPENIYRPVFGYVTDTLSKEPVKGVVVYGFDSMDDALKGKAALESSRNPMKLRLKGDVAETVTDESGRYMIPARSKGVLLFHFKDRKFVHAEQINGRMNVSPWKKEKPKAVRNYEYTAVPVFKPVPRENPDIVRMDFNCYLPYIKEIRSESRVMVERHMTDLETGGLMDSSVVVVMDGRNYHRRKLKSAAEEDTLLVKAERFPELNDATFAVNVKDTLDKGPWKSRCFRLSYILKLENEGNVRDIDTLDVLTNRVSRPMNFLEHRFEPYSIPVGRVTSVRRSVRGKLTVQGTYDGKVPQVLGDPAYRILNLNLKAVVSGGKDRGEMSDYADTMLVKALEEHRRVLGDALGGDVHITKTSVLEEPDSSSLACRMEFRYVLRTDRKFSRDEYVEALSGAADEMEYEELCIRAMEESFILEGRVWEYAANELASLCLRQGRPDVDILAPLLEEPFWRNEGRDEVAANQVMMLMASDRYDEAMKLAEMLPESFAPLECVAACMAGRYPRTPQEVEAVGRSSVRNRVVMDMFVRNVGPSTLEMIGRLPEDEALTWYLRARCLSMMYESDALKMKAAETGGIPVYEETGRCLRECIARDEGFVRTASLDSDINEDVLKEVLGVYVL